MRKGRNQLESHSKSEATVFRHFQQAKADWPLKPIVSPPEQIREAGSGNDEIAQTNTRGITEREGSLLDPTIFDVLNISDKKLHILDRTNMQHSRTPSQI